MLIEKATPFFVITMLGALSILVAVVAAVARGGEDENETWTESSSIKIQYTVEYYADQERVGRSLHEFRATGWTEWADVTITSSGQADSRVGKTQRYNNGRYTLGDLRNAPEVAESGFLKDAVYEGFPDNAVRVSKYEHERGEIVSPGPLFNAGNGREGHASEKAEIAAAPGATEEEVAQRLGIDQSGLASDKRILAACSSGEVEKCKRQGEVIRRRVVYHKETAIPLQVKEQGYQEAKSAIDFREMKVTKVGDGAPMK